eukprot:CAMPEP_0201871366 /NCGR_PEP_ID=MMETSP0902-20130614/4294_1 /ASSEMBLY_ACC=CAM_ASM_000551 /TAXON_ID=420261 /ORGANISM="Thalassiosira antarctica, Strain CCMP982" /LENGTH=354 /DNA_ID=CAMNT_0048397331 /DNA_START=66 /DNA_END=1127 /DNA_ORIENTATION=+
MTMGRVIKLWILASVSLLIITIQRDQDSFAIQNSERANQTPSDTDLRHVVVAHCTEDLSWLNQFYAFEPRVCQLTHFHIYSKCGMDVDLESTLHAVASCSSLHTITNHGTEEYAYLSYIQDQYNNNMPPTISFIQGGGITENTHLIFDIMGITLPGLQYKSLSRSVSQAWHWVNMEKTGNGEKEILTKYLGVLWKIHKQAGWLSDYRGMFTVSRERIKDHDLSVYADISGTIRRRECEERNCCMEIFFSSLFRCNPNLFQNCESGVYEGLASSVSDEDYRKDGTHGKYPSTVTNWIKCVDETLLYTKSSMNGALICIRHSNGTNSTGINIQQMYSEMLSKDVWKADLSNVTWNK